MEALAELQSFRAGRGLETGAQVRAAISTLGSTVAAVGLDLPNCELKDHLNMFDMCLCENLRGTLAENINELFKDSDDITAVEMAENVEATEYAGLMASDAVELDQMKNNGSLHHGPWGGITVEVSVSDSETMEVSELRCGDSHDSQRSQREQLDVRDILKKRHGKKTEGNNVTLPRTRTWPREAMLK